MYTDAWFETDVHYIVLLRDLSVMSYPESFLSRFSSDRFDTMEAPFHARVVCTEILSELFGLPTGLRGNALVLLTGRHRYHYTALGLRSQLALSTAPITSALARRRDKMAASHQRLCPLNLRMRIAVQYIPRWHRGLNNEKGKRTSCGPRNGVALWERSPGLVPLELVVGNWPWSPLLGGWKEKKKRAENKGRRGRGLLSIYFRSHLRASLPRYRQTRTTPRRVRSCPLEEKVNKQHRRRASGSFSPASSAQGGEKRSLLYLHFFFFLSV